MQMRRPAIHDAVLASLPVDVAEPAPVVSLAGVGKSFHAGGVRVDALLDVTLQVRAGEMLGLAGCNGAGKSTLLRTINLLDRPERGTVTVGGQDLLALDERSLRTARQGIGMVFQHCHLMASATVYEHVAFPLRLHERLNAPRLDARVQETLALTGLSEHAQHRPGQLSAAQRRRLALAQAIANRPAVLLCDEPTATLDVTATRALFDTLDNINRQLGLAIVIASHELAQLGAVCDRVAVLQEGVLVEQFALSDTSAPRETALGRELAYYSSEAYAACQWRGTPCA